MYIYICICICVFLSNIQLKLFRPPCVVSLLLLTPVENPQRRTPACVSRRKSAVRGSEAGR